MGKPLATYKSNDLVAVELYEGIYRIDNLLSEKERLYLLEIADSTSPDGWTMQNYKVLLEQAKYTYGEDDIENINAYIERNKASYWDDKLMEIADKEFCNTINERLSPFFGELYDLIYLQEIQRQYEGVGLDEHVDSGYDERIEFAVVIYVNDDFTGGELYFPEKGIEISPTAGSCLIFDTGADFLHGVRPVGPNGRRYAMAGFAWAKGSLDVWSKDH